MKRVVVIGGGTGNFVVLRGLKKYPLELTAIVSMADDGGSTGILARRAGRFAAGRRQAVPGRPFQLQPPPAQPHELPLRKRRPRRPQLWQPPPLRFGKSDGQLRKGRRRGGQDPLYPGQSHPGDDAPGPPENDPERPSCSRRGEGDLSLAGNRPGLPVDLSRADSRGQSPRP